MSALNPNITSVGTSLFATAANYLTSRAQEDRNQVRSPAQPKPAFFMIWNAIYPGLTLFGWRADAPEFAEAKSWHQVNSVLNGLSAYFVSRRQKGFELLCSLGILGTAAGYRAKMPEGEIRPVDQYIRYSAELYVGWMMAAVALTGSQIVKQDRNFLGESLLDEKTNGLASVAGLAAAGVALQQTTGWSGASAALSWGLAGAAVESRNPKAARVVAGVAAVYFLSEALRPLLKEKPVKTGGRVSKRRAPLHG